MGTHPPNRDIFSKISQVSLMPSMRWTQRQTVFSPPDGMKYTIIRHSVRNGLLHAAPCASLRGKIVSDLATTPTRPPLRILTLEIKIATMPQRVQLNYGTRAMMSGMNAASNVENAKHRLPRQLSDAPTWINAVLSIMR